MEIELKKFSYKYMEYENVLLIREIKRNFPTAKITVTKTGFHLDNLSRGDCRKLQHITYIEKYTIGDKSYDTLQAKLEHSNPYRYVLKRQGTRYSTHGLHEYKGKYNPQVVHGILDGLGVASGSRILDPFCGSGTTILECAHYGMKSVGTDINPMAVLLTNTKISSLGLDVGYVRKLLKHVCGSIEGTPIEKKAGTADQRMQYLARWIPEDVLYILEKMKKLFEKEEEHVANFLKITVSDLIREYSNQEPSDLRIRQRISPFPDMPFVEAWVANVNKYLEDIEGAQKVKKYNIHDNYALFGDIRKGIKPLNRRKFDVIITSPPYATALPYIDTQRISLVWLGLCTPKQIMALESSLIGSREFILEERKRWLEEFKSNTQKLPEQIYSLIEELNNNLACTDGFRKQAVPILLYRYFADMKKMFDYTYKLLKIKGKFALIVGNNRTTIGGKNYLIDTPYLLSELAKGSGWIVDELLPLQTYKRYGLNSKNSINSETLIILSK